MRRPSPGRITNGYSNNHQALDFGHGDGLTVVAAAAGHVVAARSIPGYGNRVVLDHGASLSTRYAHLSGMHVNAGDDVTAGQIIGTQGDTGSYANGVHLHWEVVHNGVRVDPGPYLTSPAANGTDPLEDDMTPEQAQSLADVQTTVVRLDRLLTPLTLTKIAAQVWSQNIKRGPGVSALQEVANIRTQQLAQQDQLDRIEAALNIRK